MHLVFKRLPFAFTFAYTPKATCLPRPYKPSYCPSFPDTHMLHRVLPCPQVLGAKRKTLAGFSSTTTQPHQGFIHGCAIMHTTPPSLRGKAARLIAAKSTLLARKDAYGEDPAVRGAGGHEEEGQGGGGQDLVGRGRCWGDDRWDMPAPHFQAVQDQAVPLPVSHVAHLVWCVVRQRLWNGAGGAVMHWRLGGASCYGTAGFPPGLAAPGSAAACLVHSVPCLPYAMAAVPLSMPSRNGLPPCCSSRACCAGHVPYSPVVPW